MARNDGFSALSTVAANCPRSIRPESPTRVAQKPRRSRPTRPSDCGSRLRSPRRIQNAFCVRRHVDLRVDATVSPGPRRDRAGSWSDPGSDSCRPHRTALEDPGRRKSGSLVGIRYLSKLTNVVPLNTAKSCSAAGLSSMCFSMRHRMPSKMSRSGSGALTRDCLRCRVHCPGQGFCWAGGLPRSSRPQKTWRLVRLASP